MFQFLSEQTGRFTCMRIQFQNQLNILIMFIFLKINYNVYNITKWYYRIILRKCEVSHCTTDLNFLTLVYVVIWYSWWITIIEIEQSVWYTKRHKLHMLHTKQCRFFCKNFRISQFTTIKQTVFLYLIYNINMIYLHYILGIFTGNNTMP